LAIETNGHNLLISAGAGSGKTTVLTERVLHHLRQGVNIDKLVILTFTEAAAEEMRERILSGIEKDPSLVKQKELISQATISTFDSFCLGLVRTYHDRLNLPRNVMICDNVRYEMLKHEALQTTLDSFYIEATEDFRDLVTLLFDKGDHRLIEALQTWIQELDLIVDEENYLDLYLERFDSQEARKNISNAFLNVIHQIAEDFDFYHQLIEEKISQAHSDKVVSWLRLWQSVLSTLNHVEDAFSWLRTVKNASAPRKVSLKEDDSEKELVDSLHETIKDSLVKAQKTFINLHLEHEADMVRDFEENRSIVKRLIPLMKRYVEIRKGLSKMNNQYSFSDITRFAIRLITREEDVQIELRNQYHEIMVDEYQDTNDLQNALIEQLSRNNLFLVGDIKQSIYAFRNANPRNFLNRYKAYSNHEQGMKIDLLENFRSRREVIDDINEIFLPLMDEEVGGINYTESQALIYGNDVYQLSSRNDHMKLHLIDSESIDEASDETTAQVQSIITDIQNKIQNHAKTVDLKEKKLRDLEYRDFCVLIDRKSSFDDIEKQFVDANIPIRKHSDDVFTSTEEMLFLKSLIHLMVCKINPLEHQSHFKSLFYAVAHSFVYRHLDEDIALFLHSCDGNTQDWDKMKYHPIFSVIYELVVTSSEMSKRSSLYETVLYLIQESHIYEALSQLKNASSRTKKVAYFIEKVSTFTGMNWNDLIDYFTYLRNSDSLDMDYSSNTEVSANEVQLMSMHKSKGLEFPVCYYPNIHKTFRFEENKNLFVYNRSYGLFCKLFSGGLHESMLHVLTKIDSYKEMVSERLRLFYVALTRAKEEIHFISTTKQYERSKPKYRQHPIPSMIRGSARSFLDFLTMHPTMDRYLHMEQAIKSRVIRSATDKDEIFSIQQKNRFDFESGKKQSSHFSKTSSFIETIAEYQEMMIGTRLHAFLETFDFTNSHSALEHASKFEKEVVLTLYDLFSEDFFTEGEILREYPFVMKKDSLTAHGVIDMIVLHKDEVFILDFKLKNIDDEAYARQLQGYRNALKPLTDKPIHTILVSILERRKKEIYDEF